MNNVRPTVFLVDDDAAVRSSLALLIATYGLRVISLQSAEAFLDRWHPGRIACLVLDIRMAGMSGPALQTLLQERRIDIPIVFITGHGDINACRRAFQNGAVDFLAKPVDEQALLASIKKGIAQDRERHAAEQQTRRLRKKLAQLSSREQDVLTRMLNGLTNKQIATEISLSSRTVEAHRARIFTKLQADSLAQLVRRMVQLEVYEKRFPGGVREEPLEYELERNEEE